MIRRLFGRFEHAVRHLLTSEADQQARAATEDKIALRLKALDVEWQYYRDAGRTPAAVDDHGPPSLPSR